MPQEDLARVYSKWSQIYGDIVYVNAAGQPVIVLGDLKIANELLEKRSAIYSDRPVLEMAYELSGFKEAVTSQNNNPRFKQMRKYAHRAIGTRAELEKYNSLFDSCIREFLVALHRNPTNLLWTVRHSASAIIILITYGYHVREDEDPIIQLAEDTMQDFAQVTKPGAFLVDLVPALKYVPTWFPGAGFKRLGLEIQGRATNMVETPYQFTKRETAEGIAPPSFVHDTIKGETLTPEKEHILKWAAASLYTGGTDTTVAAIYSFFLTMTLFPDAQRKAQEEIDRVIGGDRLITIADRNKLPYVNALYLEVLRWATIAPIGLPHKTQTSDTHRGYYIPKGSVIIANIWQMLHDPSVYAKPELFLPERFLETPGKPAEQDPRICAFGFGRRVCPGKQFADISVWLSMAAALSVFRISKVVEGGVEVVPDVRFEGDIVSRPEEFRCDIKPRSKQAEVLLLQQ
ncbi:cytochrome P450 [Gloeopeniophorella convolvens]|nr:cytochrome P450 [Gloeopeniophorella convolvens]